MQPKIKIIFSRRSLQRLEEIGAYIYSNTHSAHKTVEYLNRIKTFISATLTSFPEAGRKVEEFGKGTRKIVYQRYTILYRIDFSSYTIKIMTIFRENLP